MKISKYLTTLLFPFLLGISTYKQLNSHEITASAHFGVVRANSNEITSPGNIQNGYFTRFDRNGLEAIVVPHETGNPDSIEYEVLSDPPLDIRIEGNNLLANGPIDYEHFLIRYIMRDETTNGFTFMDLSGYPDTSSTWVFELKTDPQNYYGRFSEKFVMDVILPAIGYVPDSLWCRNKEDNPIETFAVLDSIRNVEERNPTEAEEGIEFWNEMGTELRRALNFYARDREGENQYCEICIEPRPIEKGIVKGNKYGANVDHKGRKENNSLSDGRLRQFFPPIVQYAEDNNSRPEMEYEPGGDGNLFPVEIIADWDTLYESHTSPDNFDFVLSKIEHEKEDSLRRWRLWYLSETNGTAPIQEIKFWFDENPVGIRDEGNTSVSLPREINLSQNYPNPFNPSTTISYSVPTGNDDAKVSLDIYNLRGQHEKNLVSTVEGAGNYSVTWNGMNEYGLPSVSGPYIYRLVVGDGALTKKMNLVK